MRKKNLDNNDYNYDVNNCDTVNANSNANTDANVNSNNDINLEDDNDTYNTNNYVFTTPDPHDI